MTMRIPCFAVALALAWIQPACHSSSSASPVECGAATVTCAMDAICCPAAQPFYCGGPVGDNTIGCYATLAEAKRVCQTQTGADGGTTTDAYQCH